MFLTQWAMPAIICPMVASRSALIRAWCSSALWMATATRLATASASSRSSSSNDLPSRRFRTWMTPSRRPLASNGAQRQERVRNPVLASYDGLKRLSRYASGMSRGAWCLATQPAMLRSSMGSDALDRRSERGPSTI